MVMVLVVFFGLVFLMFFMLFRFRAMMMMVTVGKIIFMFHAPMAVDGAHERSETDIAKTAHIASRRVVNFLRLINSNVGEVILRYNALKA